MQRVHGAVREPGSYQALQHFITHSRWDAEALWKRLRKECPERRGVVLVDDTGIPKKGSHSPGVQRQYSGTLGKVGNCQIVVSTILRAGNFSWTLGMDLYLPESWTKSPSRLRSAGIPEETPFRAKPAIALAQIRVAQKAGFRIDAVVADLGFGKASEFRVALNRAKIPFVLGVTNTVLVRAARKDADRQQAEALASALPRSAWKRITWRIGTKGPLRADFAAVRVRPAGADAENVEYWLLCERRNREKQPKYFLSSLPRKTPLKTLVGVAHTRWAIEQNYQQLKEELGFDHFEGRTWNGWAHHAVLTAATYCFLELERRADDRQNLSLPKVRELVAEILVIEIMMERPDLQAALEERKRARGPPS